jgi:hypothetical protein
VLRLRPTGRQAAARGAWRGGLVGAVLLAALLIGYAAGVRDWVGWGKAEWATVVVVGAALGAVIGAARGRSRGVDADELGLHPVPRRPGELVPWQRVAEVRAERRGWRTVVVVDTIVETTRLRAPYDGWLMAGDPGFEEKLFMLRNMWETHRSYNLP